MPAPQSKQPLANGRAGLAEKGQALGARRQNRGPSAAAGNRAALVEAAREVFAAGGYEAPLSAVARRAGVGQGSLYRHFPDRVSLAVAAFEENVSLLEDLAHQPQSTLDECLELLTEQAIASAAFMDMLSGHTGDPRVASVAERVTAIFACKLPGAQAAGRFGFHVQPADLLMCAGMVSGVIAKTPGPMRREIAERAWGLLRRALAP
jgi:AcrR family transcriptional regulator